MREPNDLYGDSWDEDPAASDSAQSELIFVFSRGSWGSDLDYYIYKTENGLRLKCSAVRMFDDIAPDHDFLFPETAIAGLIKSLGPVRKWEARYLSGVRDGYGWSIKLNYNGDRISVIGDTMFPDNYKPVKAAIQEELEKLCEKYDPEHYDREYRQKRIEL